MIVRIYGDFNGYGQFWRQKTNPIQSQFYLAPQIFRGLKKQSQFVRGQLGAKSLITIAYEILDVGGSEKTNPIRSQSKHALSAVERTNFSFVIRQKEWEKERNRSQHLINEQDETYSRNDVRA